jgi:hypothetical protein
MKAPTQFGHNKNFELCNYSYDGSCGIRLYVMSHPFVLNSTFFWSMGIYIHKVVLINNELHYLNTVYFKKNMAEEQDHLLLPRGADKSLAFSISYFPICSTTKRIFLRWVREVRTTKS